MEQNRSEQIDYLYIILDHFFFTFATTCIHLYFASISNSLNQKYILTIYFYHFIIRSYS